MPCCRHLHSTSGAGLVCSPPFSPLFCIFSLSTFSAWNRFRFCGTWSLWNLGSSLEKKKISNSEYKIRSRAWEGAWASEKAPKCVLHKFRLNWPVSTTPLADPFPRALSPVPGPFGRTWSRLWPSAFCQHKALGLCVPALHRATWGSAGPPYAGVPSSESWPASTWPGLKWEATAGPEMCG